MNVNLISAERVGVSPRHLNNANVFLPSFFTSHLTKCSAKVGISANRKSIEKINSRLGLSLRDQLPVVLCFCGLSLGGSIGYNVSHGSDFFGNVKHLQRSTVNDANSEI